MTEEGAKYLEKAERALAVARELLEGGHPPDAVSKAYYAMFYAAQALLASQGIEVVKHSAVEAAIGFHFAKTGRLDPKYHRMLMSARTLREMADYDLDEEIAEETASLKVDEGRAFLEAIRAILGTP